MSKLEKVSLIDLVNKYRYIVGEEIESVVITSIFSNNDKNVKRMFDKKINLAIREAEEYMTIQMKREDRQEIRLNAIYEIMCQMLEKMNLYNMEKCNRDFLMEINRRFANKMSKKERDELLSLILGKNEYEIYLFDTEEYPEVVDVEIVTKEKSKRITDIEEVIKREILKVALIEQQKSGNMLILLKEQYKDKYDSIRTKVVANLVKTGKITIEEYKDIKESCILLEKNEKIKEIFDKEETEFFENNYQYIDEEKLLLSFAASIMFGIRLQKDKEIETSNDKMKNENQENRKRVRENSILLLRMIYEELKPMKHIDKEIGIYNENGEILIISNQSTIEQFLSRCIEKDYLTDEEIEKIHSELLQGNLTPNLEERKIAGLNIDDLLKMTEIYNIEEEKREKILPSAIELAEYLKDTGDTTNEQLIDLYLKGKLNLDLVSKLNMDDISEEFFRNKLEEMYAETLDCQVQEEKKQQFKELTRFTNLYKSLEEQEKLEIDKDKIIEEIIKNNYSESNINNTIGDLNKIGLINLEEAIGWTGTDTIIRRYKEGNLKPAEVRDCYNKDKITLDQLADIIKMIPENSERFMMIGGIFPEEEDIETRDVLILECMKLEEGLKRETKGVNIKRTEREESNNYNKYITDPFARLSLIQGLDSEYSFEMSADGHAIIKLPTLGKVIIEKMLDKNNLPSYGSATYILDEEYYQKNHEEIVMNNRINRSRMIKDLENEGVDRIIHGVESWGKNIKEYFGVSKESRWSNQDIKKINDAIERIKRTYRTI